jgi:DNA modification methylase
VGVRLQDEVSYRACYKPQLPRLFIEKLTQLGDIVYDPFGGRGTTAVEAALLGRRVISNDINPLSRILAQPRLTLPDPEAVKARLGRSPSRAPLRMTSTFRCSTTRIRRRSSGP